MKEYDEKDPKSIESYGKEMIGETFQDIWENNKNNREYGVNNRALHERTASYQYASNHTRKEYKGGLGNLVEECYFRYHSNSDSDPDFPEAGVELKVTPYKRIKNGIAAKERLILTMINYFSLIKEPSFEESHLWHKTKLMLLVWYLYEKGIPKLDFRVDYVSLFTPPPEDLKIIKQDYEKIVDKVRKGKAHELSEGDTLYLGAATKSSDSSKRRKQPCSPELAKPRAFSFKNSYMTHILRSYIANGSTTAESIVRHGETVSDFEKYVIDKIRTHKGKSVPELCREFSVNIEKKPKNLESILAFRILGVKGNHAEEFEKAGVVVKAIRIEANGKIKESMSFPVIDYQKLANETWDNSCFGNYLRDTRFFFVIYKRGADGKLYLSGSQFWNIPQKDLEGDVREVWQETHDIIASGRLTICIDEKGGIRNNLPKMKDHLIAHVRPHARNRQDMKPLPKGTDIQLDKASKQKWKYGARFIKQCFWLRNTYILSQIAPENR